MNLTIIIFIFLSLSFKSSAAQRRISETKCREYSEIPTDGSKLHPHLVWLRIATKDVIVVGVIGTLISKNFVLTSAVKDLIVHQSQVYFKPDEYYNIVERYSHPFFGGTAHYDIALLRLERAIELNGLHRPACLWTSENYESATIELIKWNSGTWTDNYEVKTLNIITGSGCTDLHSQQNESLICAKPIATEDHNYVATPGSPFQIFKPDPHLSNNYYVYGIFSFFYHNVDPYIQVGSKTYFHLNWIEEHVWPAPTHQDSSCGYVNDNFRSTNHLTTLHGEFPWHTALYELVALGERNYKCDGTLLNEFTLLTVANCVATPSILRSPSVLVAITGVYDLEMMTDRRQEIRVARIIVQNNPDNSLALIKLRSHVTLSNYVQPICLSSNEFVRENRVGLVPGWGQMDFDMNNSKLSKSFLSIRSVSDRAFSAVHQNETGGCSGSLGGGFVIEYNNRWYLLGIMNIGFSSERLTCDQSNLVSFTDVVKSYQWIQENL